MLTGTNGTDISKRAIRLGRMLDRLEPGQYALEFVKRGDAWDVVVKSVEDDQTATIRRVQIRDEGISKQEGGLAETG